MLPLSRPVRWVPRHWLQYKALDVGKYIGSGGPTGRGALTAPSLPSTRRRISQTPKQDGCRRSARRIACPRREHGVHALDHTRQGPPRTQDVQVREGWHRGRQVLRQVAERREPVLRETQRQVREPRALRREESREHGELPERIVEETRERLEGRRDEGEDSLQPPSRVKPSLLPHFSGGIIPDIPVEDVERVLAVTRHDTVIWASVSPYERRSADLGPEARRCLTNVRRTRLVDDLVPLGSRVPSPAESDNSNEDNFESFWKQSDEEAHGDRHHRECTKCNRVKYNAGHPGRGCSAPHGLAAGWILRETNGGIPRDGVASLDSERRHRCLSESVYWISRDTGSRTEAMRQMKAPTWTICHARDGWVKVIPCTKNITVGNRTYGLGEGHSYHSDEPGDHRRLSHVLPYGEKGWQTAFKESQENTKTMFHKGMRRRQHEFLLKEASREKAFAQAQAAWERRWQWQAYLASQSDEYLDSRDQRAEDFQVSQMNRDTNFYSHQRDEAKEIPRVQRGGEGRVLRESERAEFVWSMSPRRLRGLGNQRLCIAVEANPGED
ncbi:hypothetical protein GLOTRDRAFT_97051 [Gloeophyllum trabeum ATCC 11539]|uniref:Uncharacterized protein n=1 Tax=Gloeophyllum trabeum (strain ATCC 11539 / FP-39264 / Madison 617) TaxID=670483 RepID=S7PST3_GLOTA|nr:uncharacterized protein GLOTRDRAFT_97051 [Gloeophyllum trabeum ATCC 11539]EPQ50437.1 hypothetical protein GLOTRDRAFT_97051 [Gloeophyllum trabeum ATCC 11539]